VAELQKAGVRQILSRDCAPLDLLTALLVVRRQRPEPPRPAVCGPSAPTRRELEVVTLLAKGLSNRDIARQLFISEHTVRNHLGHVFSKLDVSSRTQAVVRAGELGWLRLPG
jgi:DNA-binding NarL/FixJ family response regulator